MMNFIRLFLTFLQVGAFSFGGGYAAMPLIQELVVKQNGWLDKRTFQELITISQMTPGPIAINAATFVGIQIEGIPGAMVATVGEVLPSCIIVTILAILYTKYKEISLLKGVLESLRPTVVALILSSGLMILVTAVFKDGSIGFANHNFQLRPVILFALGLYLLRRKKISPIKVMILCGSVELCVQSAMYFLA